MELTGAKLRRCGIPSAARISAAFYGSAAAAARPRVGQGGLAELGCYLRPPRRAGQANREGHARPFPTHDGVRLRHEVETSPTGGPHLSATQGRRTRSAVEEERGEAWRTAAGLLRPGGLGPSEGGKSGPRLPLGPERKRRGGSGPSGRFPGRGRRKINLSFFYSKPLSNLI